MECIVLATTAAQSKTKPFDSTSSEDLNVKRINQIEEIIAPEEHAEL